MLELLDGLLLIFIFVELLYAVRTSLRSGGGGQTAARRPAALRLHRKEADHVDAEPAERETRTA